MEGSGSVIIGSTQCPDCWGKKGREIITSHCYVAGMVMRIGKIRCEQTGPVLKVQYMCDETGVGSGTLWNERDLYGSLMKQLLSSRLKGNNRYD